MRKREVERGVRLYLDVNKARKRKGKRAARECHKEVVRKYLLRRNMKNMSRNERHK